MSEKLKTILIFIFFLLLYFAFRSVEFDVTEGIALDEGALYSPNHMLNRPIANTLWNISKIAGYAGRSIHVLQILNVFYGAIAVAISFVAFRKLGAASWAALAGSILLGTSYIFWYESTDAYYIVLSAMFSAAALLCSAILVEKRSIVNAFLLAVCFACATLSWQATVLLFPMFAWSLRRRLKELMTFGITSFVIIASVYVAVGISQEKTDITQLVHWLTRHAGGNIPWWGKMELSRIPVALYSAMQSFQVYAPVWLISYFRSLYHYEPTGSGAGTICLVLLGIAVLIRGVQIVFRGNYKIVWLFSGYIIIFAFLVWWEPVDLKNFVPPNIFLCATIAIIFSSWKPLPFIKMLVFAAIAVMAVVTFKTSIWPRHINSGINMRKAECVHWNVSTKDKVMSSDWSFTGELLYFYKIRTIEIISLSAYFHGDHEKLMNEIYKEVEKTRSEGGKVFIVSPDSYSPDHIRWLAEQTTFTLTDFNRFPGKPAFQCEELRYRELTSVGR